ncbi:MAG TPA: phosphomevalonate kinase, partial [Gammaproteobacteria bacterium]|nr:phosphomevalonate kinase [Gammaproteobacteria bacterium]
MFVARAPGKLVALGEYAVLDGAPAVVLALDRYAEVTLDETADGVCRLTTRSSTVVERRFDAGKSSGAALVDLVAAAAPHLAWTATIDSQAFFAGSAKLGLGSSAAVLTAWAGAFAAFARDKG